MKNEKLWSLKIPIKKNVKDKDIQNYFIKNYKFNERGVLLPGRPKAALT